MDFTSKEKSAIIVVLWHIVKADGVVAPDEQKFMDLVFRDLGISINELQQTYHMDIEDCKKIIDSMSDEKKEKVSKCFLQMVGIDGRVDLRELRVLKGFV